MFGYLRGGGGGGGGGYARRSVALPLESVLHIHTTLSAFPFFFKVRSCTQGTLSREGFLYFKSNFIFLIMWGVCLSRISFTLFFSIFHFFLFPQESRNESRGVILFFDHSSGYTNLGCVHGGAHSYKCSFLCCRSPCGDAGILNFAIYYDIVYFFLFFPPKTPQSMCATSRDSVHFMEFFPPTKL